MALGFENQGQCVQAANQAAQAGEPFPPPEECIPSDTTECEQDTEDPEKGRPSRCAQNRVPPPCPRSVWSPNPPPRKPGRD